ncbi:hypothetical protein K435DRAFT_809536 [Dendrothele bispora CBS 962.96]|uniref:Uncharacterized protein n=1 Tax=Dendrothele bispora (strain CBS 962.96) TaxID=1314807 RepID=A0A4S8KY96_DENBC|nr:hypothetical protein K435DRAFT_809536 [Dendrothele bispora CBS 962.96]
MAQIRYIFFSLLLSVMESQEQDITVTTYESGSLICYLKLRPESDQKDETLSCPPFLPSVTLATASDELWNRWLEAELLFRHRETGPYHMCNLRRAPQCCIRTPKDAILGVIPIQHQRSGHRTSDPPMKV